MKVVLGKVVLEDAVPQAPGVPRGPERRPEILERDTSADGLMNTLFVWLLTHFRPFWAFIQSVPLFEGCVNMWLVNHALKKGPTRPDPLSMRDDYASWPSLTDRTWFGRHLPPVAPRPGRPSTEAVMDLFRRERCQHDCPKSSVLFVYFAQWFSDAFLRARMDPQGNRIDNEGNPTLRTESSHQIDLSTLYGVTSAQTMALRAQVGGRLKSQSILREEFPPFYCDPNGVPKAEFNGVPPVLPPPTQLDDPRLAPLPLHIKRQLFALGFPRGNGTPGFLMMQVLFLREHNRIAGILARAHPDWDDERVFQTTRNVLIVVLMKIVVEDYINHIAPYHFKFRLVAGRRIKAPWYRPNWVTLEFYLLYRWHSLVPDNIQFGTRPPVDIGAVLHQPSLLVQRGLWDAFVGASLRRAGRIGLFNTPPFLVARDWASVDLGRRANLATYNDYREAYSFPRLTTFDQLSSDPRVRRELQRLYGTVDRVELYPGLFAEDPRPNSPLGPLMGRMVGIDAFSQALTHPLLAERVFNADTFSPEGLRIIRQTRSLRDVLERNVVNDFLRTVPKTAAAPVSFTYGGAR